MTSSPRSMRRRAQCMPMKPAAPVTKTFIGLNGDRPPFLESACLTDKPVVIGMRADPKPKHAIGDFDPEGAITDSHANGIEASNPLEMQRGMGSIAQKLLKTAVRESLNRDGKRTVALPEFRRSVVVQNFVDLPEACAFSASSASWSSLPPRPSASN